MSEPRKKLCPVCRALAPIDASACAGCGHAYRTRFAAPPPAPSVLAPAVPMPAVPLPMGAVHDPRLPLPPESRLLLTSVPPPPAPRSVAHLPDPRSVSSSLDSGASYAKGQRQLPWIKAAVALYVLYRIVHFLMAFRHMPRW